MSRYLGQHWLKNPEVIKKIVAGLKLKKGETVIEIGPGRGALTWPLFEQCKKLSCSYIGIEKDVTLAHELATRMKNYEVRSKGKYEIIAGDALRILPALILNSNFLPLDRYAIVGNLPYYITGKILRTISELEHKPEQSVLMVQKEVGERLAAQPPKMNLLAAATQIWAEARVLFEVPAKDFSPPPKVNSAVVELRIKPGELKKEGLESYYAFIHAAFKQPRKMLLNNLATGLAMPKNQILEVFTNQGIDEKTRAQDLSVERLRQLAIAMSQPLE
ncbi:MAG: ribosomal RNA small subunit methyltransferase A [Candidatus Harrisonbacteria bacterium CG10_big_fil_rev_8_21_14_0_10_49_15]|uniref:Ribosomal RNA small subunit methyltransferase A n=1 Tax=Candidatus Harrisonbacteria bacterium CG10_big_fil_rev_8_21_14_0_10_49_15 TaxID=1974587 RepID=A0A2H0UKE1_9BACT|nr:MAG: ribosomal RNA small subunit methyltransferase A [Candidatus Harrisonbacteria bacterium CG10_big_fil_rev_8_21_14_0_10_49_15]